MSLLRKTDTKTTGFRLGIYVFKDTEIIDYSAPYGVFSVVSRLEQELDAFLIPGGFGSQQEIYNKRLHSYIRLLPEQTLLTSVFTASWIYGNIVLLNGILSSTSKEPDPIEQSNAGMVPIDCLAKLTPQYKISRSRVLESYRIVTGGGIAAGMEVWLHLH